MYSIYIRTTDAFHERNKAEAHILAIQQESEMVFQ